MKGNLMNTEVLTPRRVAIALVSVGLIGIGSLSAFGITRAHAIANQAHEVVTPLSGAALPDFAKITERYGPSVVNISVSGITKTSSEDTTDISPSQNRTIPRIDPSAPFFDFYKHFIGPNGRYATPRETPVHAQGSGFIVNSDGVILTNAHVVRDAKVVTVRLTDRREFIAKVIGTDAKTDVAVLKIDTENLPCVATGNTRDLRVGEWVLAIGSPFGFDNSVTAGVVSAKGRSLPDDTYVPFIQTDVAVNPGNSGGPLFNARGEVVGINSQIYSHTGGYQGLSFAIPIELAINVKDQILATGKASHARLGVSIQDVNQTFADSFKLAKPEGALVSAVEDGGPADRAGLKAGDVILQANRQTIISSNDLPALIGNSAPGEKVVLEIWRQGKQVEFTAKLEDASEMLSKIASTDESSNNGKLGLALRPILPQERRVVGAIGLMVEDSVGASAMAGVQPGDVLVAVNGTPIQSIDQVRAIVSKSNRSVALLIQRDGNRIFVPVRIG
jgi:serine protease Do